MLPTQPDRHDPASDPCLRHYRRHDGSLSSGPAALRSRRLALALLASLAAGTVSAKDAFSGFADDIVIIVWSALIVSAAVARSGIVESLLAGPPRGRAERAGN